MIQIRSKKWPKPNPDPNIKGFLTHMGNKYAIQAGNDAHLEGYLFNAYMNQQDFAMQSHQDKPGPIEDPDRVDDYFDNAETISEEDTEDSEPTEEADPST